MLDAAWLIPTLPALSFFAILLFGKRFPRKGSELGILAVGVSFVLSCVALGQWIDRVESVTGKHEGLRALGAGVFAAAQHGREVVRPIVHHVTWWENGKVNFGVGTRIDGLAVILMFVVTFISLVVHIYSTAYLRMSFYGHQTNS